MTETARLKLPLLQASQAQKHVTVNEALVLLDSLGQLALDSRSTIDPPSTIVEGACYAVPAGATGDWAAHVGKLAIGSNGGWMFVTPTEAWRAWILDEKTEVVYSAGTWLLRPLSGALFGSGVTLQTVESEHVLSDSNAQDLVGAAIPAETMVFAVSARVVADLSGTLTSWRFGVAGAEDRFGSGMGPLAGSYASGILGTPQTYYAAAPLRITPEGGTLTGGTLRIAMHYLSFSVPNA